MDNQQEIDIARLGESIHEYRTHMNYSLRETADVIGDVSMSTLQRLESGNGYPDLDTYFRICRLLKVPISEFMNIQPIKRKEKPIISHKTIILSAISKSKELSNEHKSMLTMIIQWAYEISIKK